MNNLRTLRNIVVLTYIVITLQSTAYGTPIHLEPHSFDAKKSLSFINFERGKLSKQASGSQSSHTSNDVQLGLFSLNIPFEASNQPKWEIPQNSFQVDSNSQSQGISPEIIDERVWLAEQDWMVNVNMIHDLLESSNFIPERLINWKASIDSMIYENRSFSKESDYQNTSSLNHEQYVDWSVLFDSFYFTWLKVAVISILFVSIMLDILKKYNRFKSKRKISRRKKLRRRSRI